MGDETGTRNAGITRKILSKTISKLLKNNDNSTTGCYGNKKIMK